MNGPMTWKAVVLITFCEFGSPYLCKAAVFMLIFCQVILCISERLLLSSLH